MSDRCSVTTLTDSGTAAHSRSADSVNPAVVEVMAEVGIDISREFPKKLLTEEVAAFDVVITMGRACQRLSRGRALCCHRSCFCGFG